MPYYKMKNPVELRHCKMPSSYRVYNLMIPKPHYMQWIKNNKCNDFKRVNNKVQPVLQLIIIESWLIAAPLNDTVRSWFSLFYRSIWKSIFIIIIDHFQKWPPLTKSFQSIKISLTNIVLKLVIQKNIYFEMRLVSLI